MSTPLKAGFKIQATDERGKVVHNTIGRDIEQTLMWVRAVLESSETMVTVTEEDLAIRDSRREHGVDPDVEIEGPIGFRSVKRSG